MNPSVKNKRNSNVSMEQKKLLLEFIKKHSNLASGKLSNNFTQKDAQGLWQQLTNILNSCGAQKDWKSWRKTWQDIRSRTKIKSSQFNKQQRHTGGGPCPENPTSEYENEVLNTIKLVAIQGHNEVSESPTEFNFDSLQESESTFVDDSMESENKLFDEMPKALKERNLITAKPTISEAISLADTVSQPNSNTPIMKKKFPRAPRKKLVYASEAAENYKISLDKKNEIKCKYYEKKLIILERIAVAKEQSAAAKEKFANAVEEIASECSTGIKGILEAFC